MPETRQSVERRLSEKRRLLVLLEEQIARYTELEAPVSKLAERDRLREEVSRLGALLESGGLLEADEAKPSVWEGLEARIEPEEAPLAHPSSPKALLEKTGRTLMAVQFKVRHPAQPQKLKRIALGVLIALVLLAAGFWAYTYTSTQLAPVPWPTPKIEAKQTPVLGFGDLWNGDPGVQNRLGMGVNGEQSILYLEQRFEHGIMLDPPPPFVYVLYEDRQWELYKEQTVKDQETPTEGLVVAPSFRSVYDGAESVPERLGSPQSPAQEVRGAIQDFEQGQMIWTGAADRHIYTLFVMGDQPDKWALYADKWVAPGDVVFASNWTGHWHIHTMTSGGTDKVQLTGMELGNTDDFEPVWVPPERKSIAFVSTASGSPKIWLVDRNGSNRRQLTAGSGADGHPSVAWDGDLLAFHSDRDGIFQIYLIDLDGNNLRRLTNDSFNNRHPDWAPDGQSLAFDSERADRRGIYSVNVDTGSVELLLNPKDGEAYQQPTWSPDGTRLAFVSRAAGQHAICVTNTDGSELTKIEETAGFEKADTPVWSPDGQRLAFTAYEGGKASIVLVNVSDGSIAARISGYGEHKDPEW